MAKVILKRSYFFSRMPGGVFPYNRLMGMCRWLESHFHNWSDCNGVASSIELIEWSLKYLDFGGK